MFDAIVSNPPYIPSVDIIALDPPVRDYEPLCALDGGSDGLRFFREITEKWMVALNDGGHLAFECGIGQAEAVGEIMRQNGFDDIRKLTDTLGIERVVVGRLTKH